MVLTLIPPVNYIQFGVKTFVLLFSKASSSTEAAELIVESNKKGTRQTTTGGLRILVIDY